MKIIVLSIAAAVAWQVSARAADSSVKISDVHICCKGCVAGIEKAVSKVAGAKAEADQDAGTITLTGPDTGTLQKAADSLVAAGYFGKSSDPAITLDASTGARGEKVQTLHVEGVHLCCAKCVKAVDRVVKAVPGAKEHTAVKGAKSFEVTGDFNDKDFFAALQKEGLTGKEGKEGK